MNDIYKILEFTSKSHKEPVYLLNDIDRVKMKMISPAKMNEIKFGSGEVKKVSIEADIHSRTLKNGREITKEEYENNNFPFYPNSSMKDNSSEQNSDLSTSYDIDKQIKEFFVKLDSVLIPKIKILEKYEPIEIQAIFKFNYEAIVGFYVLMNTSNFGAAKKTLIQLFGKATEQQLNEVHQLLTFLFFYQHDRELGSAYLKSKSIHKGLKKVWFLNELEINNLREEFNSTKHPGGYTGLLWEKLDQILVGNDNNSGPLYVFPALGTSFKNNMIKLDSFDIRFSLKEVMEKLDKNNMA